MDHMGEIKDLLKIELGQLKAEAKAEAYAEVLAIVDEETRKQESNKNLEPVDRLLLMRFSDLIKTRIQALSKE